MTKIREQFINNMILRNYSKKTIKSYVNSVEALTKYHNKSPLMMSKSDVESYLLNMINVKKCAPSTCNLHLAGIKYFYKIFEDVDDGIKQIRTQKRGFHIPCVFTQAEAQHFLSCIDNLKYKTLFTIIYSSGLRVNEATHLKPHDIRSKEDAIFVREGKGKKDRYTILSQNALLLLYEYYKIYRPKKWLFEGEEANKPLPSGTIQKAFKRYLKIANLDELASVHTLRHCFATHLLEQGSSINTIQRLLGHSNMNTTAKYLHISHEYLSKIISPLDMLEDLENA